MEKEALKRRAIGALAPVNGLSALASGTAFAVTDRHALTAFHCVGEAATGQVTTPEVRIRFSEQDHVDATVERVAPAVDLALLRLKGPLPSDHEPLALARAGNPLRHLPFLVSGFPIGRPFQDAIPMSGTIADPLATIFDGVPAIALASWQAATGLPLHGFSGAPVIVRPDPAAATSASPEVAVGVIRWMPIDPERPDTAQGGLVYATPMSAAWEWPEVRSSFVQAAQASLPYETAIRNFTHYYLGNPGRPMPFGGRERELRRLSSWLDDLTAPPFMLVATPAGLGKSALMVQWCEQLERVESVGVHPVFVPITVRWELNTRTAVFQALAARLAVAYDETASKAVDPLEDVARFLRRPLSGRPRPVVVLDGIDEADGWDASPALLPMDVSVGVRVVVTARVTADRPRPEDWLAALGWSAGDAETLSLEPLSLEGVRDAISSMGPKLAAVAGNQQAVATLHRVTEGDPLVLSLYLFDLWDRGPGAAEAAIDELDQREPGLASYMEGWWRDQEKLWGKKFGRQETAVRVVFDLLSCAIGPLLRSELLHLARAMVPLDTDSLDEVLTILRRFVVKDPKTGGYAVSHPRLAAHRRARLLQDGDLPRYEEPFLSWGRQTVEALVNGSLQPDQSPSYVVRHYGRHLEQAGAPLADLLKLVGPAWRDAWDLVTDEYEGDLADVARAQDRLAQTNRLAVDRGKRPQHVADHVWCAMWRASTRSQSELITAELGAQLVRFGRWPAGRALALVRQMEDFYARALALAAIAPVLSANEMLLAEDMLAELQTTDPLGFGPAFASVVAALCRHGQVDRARRLVQEQAPGYARGLAITGLAGFVSESEWHSTLASIGEDVAASDPLAKGYLLKALTDAVPREIAVRVFGSEPSHDPDRAATAILPSLVRADELPDWYPDGPPDWADLRPHWLASLLPWLSEQSRRTALTTVIERLEEAGELLEVNPALQALAPFLDGDLASRALRLTKQRIPHKSWRVVIFAGLLSRIPKRQHDAVRRWVVQHLPEGLENAGGYEELEALIQPLVLEGLASDMLDAIDAINEDWLSHDYLEHLAPYLTPEQAKRAVPVALRTRHEIRGKALAPVLARLASFSADSADEALQLAIALSKDPDEVRVAQAILKAAAGRSAGLEPLWEVEDESLRYAGLVTASLFVAISGEDVARAVLSFGRESYQSNRLALATFAEFVDRLSDEEVASVSTLLALEDVVGGRVHEAKAEILIGFFSRLASLGRSNQALNVAGRLSSSTFSFPLMCAVAGVAIGVEDLDPNELRQVVNKIEPGIYRATAEAALLRHRSEPDQQKRYLRVISKVGQWDAQMYPGDIRVLVALLPSEFQRSALDALFTEEYLRGQATPVSRDSWAGSIYQLVPVLERDQLDLLLEAADNVGSSSTRGRLRAAIASRLVTLGSHDEAFQLLRYLDHAHTALSLEWMLESAPNETIGPIVERVHDLVPVPIWRNDRARVWAKATDRLRRLPFEEQWTLVEHWLARPLSTDDFLLDLVAYVPTLHAAGGKNVAADLLERLHASPGG
jgi:hypothetical protein